MIDETAEPKITATDSMPIPKAASQHPDSPFFNIPTSDRDGRTGVEVVLKTMEFAVVPEKSFVCVCGEDAVAGLTERSTPERPGGLQSYCMGHFIVQVMMAIANGQEDYKNSGLPTVEEIPKS